MSWQFLEAFVPQAIEACRALFICVAKWLLARLYDRWRNPTPTSASATYAEMSVKNLIAKWDEFNSQAR